MEKNNRYTAERKITLPNDIFFQKVAEMLKYGNSVTIPVKGNSMIPFIVEKRDHVLLKKTESVSVGDIVLAIINKKDYVLHRIYDIDGDNIKLMGDGNVSVYETCSLNDICGTVTHIERRRGMVNVSSKPEKFKARIWRNLLPFRKYLISAFHHYNRLLRG